MNFDVGPQQMFPLIPQQKQFEREVSRRIFEKSRSPYLNHKSTHLISEFKANKLKQFIHKDQLIKQLKDKELDKAKERYQKLKVRLKGLEERERKCQEFNYAQKISRIGELKHQIASFKKNKGKSMDIGQLGLQYQQSEINDLDRRIRRKLKLQSRLSRMIQEKRERLQREDYQVKSINDTDIKEQSCVISSAENEELQLQELKACQQLLGKQLQNLNYKHRLTDAKIAKSLRNLRIVCRFLKEDLPRHLQPSHQLTLIPEQSDIIYN